MCTTVPGGLAQFSSVMAWLMTYGIVLIPLCACAFGVVRCTSRIPLYKALVLCHLFYAAFFGLLASYTVWICVGGWVSRVYLPIFAQSC